MGIQCSPLGATPVKCPLYGPVSPPLANGCVASVDMCLDFTNLTFWASTGNDNKPQLGNYAQCPDNGNRCMDGSCRTSGSSLCRFGTCPFMQSQCAAITVATSFFCPQYLPHICPSGLCARNADECEAPNHCPSHLPVRCPATTSKYGVCVAEQEDCGADVPVATVCPAGQHPCKSTGDVIPFCVPCPNSDVDEEGFCTLTSQCPVQSTGCPAGQYMCNDRQCVDGTRTQCNNGGSDLVNACPVVRPHRCDDGWCAISASFCPIFPTVKNITCPAAFPVLCADGLCRLSSDQCPTIRPCMVNGMYASGSMRCPDGSCGVAPPSQYSVSVPVICPATNPCAANAAMTGRPYRCPNGLCAANNTDCVVDSTGKQNSGCLASQHKCTNGFCAANASSCPPPTPANGCNSVNATKCSNGECVAHPQDCTTICPASTPYLCLDGTCAATLAQCSAETECPNGLVRCGDGTCNTRVDCLTIGGCPAHHPIRCASGHCAKFPAYAIPAGGINRTVFLELWGEDPTTPQGTLDSPQHVAFCPPRPVCHSLKPFLCADGECVAMQSQCRPLFPCPTSQPVMCSDLTCAATQADCGDSNYRCPVGSPAMCPDGSCRKSVRQCTVSVNAHPDKADRNAITSCINSYNSSVLLPITCWDGTCASTYLECIQRRYEALPGAGTFDRSADLAFNSPCNYTTETVCSDGHCAAFPSQCGVVPACPLAYPLRCPDGSCSNAGCNPTPPACVLSARGVDGTCRTTALPFNGCPLTAPYYCAGLAAPCVASVTQCMTRFQLGATSLPENYPAEGFTGQVACTVGCDRDIAATAHAVTVPIVGGVHVDVSYDYSYSLRTRIFVPSGGLSNLVSNGGHVRVAPYSTARTPGILKSFYQKVLSTPFTCTTSLYEATGNPLLPLNFTVKGAIDTTLYSTSTSTVTTPTSRALAYPCEFRQTWRWSPYINAPTMGSITISRYSMTWRAGPKYGFPAYQDSTGGPVDAERTMIPDQILQTYNTGDYCICSNITASPDYPSEVGQRLCIRMTQNARFVYLSTNDAALATGSYNPVTGLPYFERASRECPQSGVFQPGPDGFGSTSHVMSGTPTSLQPNDPCAADAAASNTQILGPDVCLAKYTAPATIVSDLGNARIDATSAGDWTCVEALSERQVYPTWSDSTGRPRSRVEGRLSVCDGQTVYAFVNDPLPAPQPVVVAPASFWDEYLGVVVGVVCGVVVACALAAYGIWRLNRYRIKYKKEKETLAEKRAEVQKLDEYSGGIGIFGDGEEQFHMTANPLVIEMQELEREMKRVNEDMKMSAIAEEDEINDLEIQRQKIYAEIKRVKAQLDEQQRAQPTAVEVRQTRPAAAAPAGAVQVARSAPAASAPKMTDIGGKKGPKKKNF